MTSLNAYDVIRRPIITEKATLASENNQVIFEVAVNSTKPEIKSAIEELFKVKVKSVNTILTKGKVKRFRGRPYRKNNTKKAVVTLVEGHSIDVTSGL